MNVRRFALTRNLPAVRDARTEPKSLFVLISYPVLVSPSAQLDPVARRLAETVEAVGRQGRESDGEMSVFRNGIGGNESGADLSVCVLRLGAFFSAFFASSSGAPIIA